MVHVLIYEPFLCVFFGCIRDFERFSHFSFSENIDLSNFFSLLLHLYALLCEIVVRSDDGGKRLRGCSKVKECRRGFVD